MIAIGRGCGFAEPLDLRSRTEEKGIKPTLNVWPTLIQRPIFLELTKWYGHVTRAANPL
jgi:hypothetical protein